MAVDNVKTEYVDQSADIEDTEDYDEGFSEEDDVEDDIEEASDDFDDTDEFDEDEDGMHQNDRFHHHRNYGRGRQEEERFGKLKFTMPKFDGGSDPESYLTCLGPD